MKNHPKIQAWANKIAGEIKANIEKSKKPIKENLTINDIFNIISKTIENNELAINKL